MDKNLKIEKLKLVDIVKKIVSVEERLPPLKAISDIFGDERPEYKTQLKIKLFELNSLYREIARRDQYS